MTPIKSIYKAKRAISRLSFGLLSAAALCVAGCSDDFMAPDMSGSEIASDTQLVLTMYLPAQPSESGDTRAEAPLSDSETKVNSLDLIAFGVEGGEAIVRRSLDPPSKMPAFSDGSYEYSLKGFIPGKYNVYILANIPGSLLNNVNSENSLKAALLDYTGQLPQAGNLPMVYEPGAYVEIGATGEQAASVPATLTIAAVKVSFNLLFDKTRNQSVFGENGMRIVSANVSNVAKNEYIVCNTGYTNAPVREVTISGSYFNNYNYTASNASISSDMVAVSGNGASTLSDYTSKWVWRSTFYLPERYVASSGAGSVLTLNTVVTDKNSKDGNARCKYTIDLGNYNNGASVVKDKNLPRGSYYEIVGNVKTLGDNAEIDTFISLKDWTEVAVNADIMGATLTLDASTFSVSSLDEINHTEPALNAFTDARGGVDFQCETKLQNLPVIQPTKTSLGSGNYRYTLNINPSILVNKLATNEGKGTATCYIIAGNIKKKISVAYDISPFMIVTPAEHEIYWNKNGENLLKQWNYATNLGGLMLCTANTKTMLVGYDGSSRKTSASVTRSNSTLKLACADPTQARGTFTVEASTDPQTTTEHTFSFYPSAAAGSSNFDSMKSDVKVTVKPEPGNYRIYFRAINDWHSYDGGESNISGEWLQGENSMTSSNYPTEYYGLDHQNNNWIDWWYVPHDDNGKISANAKNGASNNRYPYMASHRIYIWTQTGETTSSTLSAPAWIFTEAYNYNDGNANNMTEDYGNPGWYYYDLPVNQAQKSHSNGATGNKYPEPGRTLIIFNNHTNADLGYAVHRAPHHLDPGLSLFDYEDLEGWVLYDPTSEPYFRVFDDKPVIEDVVYTVWSTVRPTGWYKKYGVAENAVSKNPRQFTIYNNNVSNVTTRTVGGKTYYCYKIRMKAPHGEYAKAIKINFGAANQQTQRVYYYCRNGNGWNNPRVYIYNGGDYMTSWDNAPTMKVEKSDSYGTWYYYDVPSAYSYGQVIFRSSNGSEQHPGANQAGLNLDGKSRIFYSDSKSWMDYNTELPDNGVVIFGGRSFPGNTGTYDASTGKWTAGEPK